MIKFALMPDTASKVLQQSHAPCVIAIGPFAGAAHVDRAQKVCLSCNSGALGNERHLIFERAGMQIFSQAALIP